MVIDLRRLKDLRKIARRDTDDRDRAVTYIDGEILESYTHGECINGYLMDKYNTHLNDPMGRPVAFDSDYEDDLNDDDTEDLEKIEDKIKQMAFAHKDEEDKVIYVEDDTLYNIDLYTVAKALKQKYPDYDILTDLGEDKIAKDLRKQVTALKVKPKDSKDDDFHLSLAQYLYKELKCQGVNVTKHDVILKVSLKNKHKDKYENVVIDCLAGKLYLRGKEVSDRYFGRLKRFQGGQRQSDAYHCASQSIKRIMDKLKMLEEEFNSDNLEVLATMNIVDLRGQRNIITIDMRTKKKKDLRKTANKKIVDLRGKKNIITIDMRKNVKTAEKKMVDLRGKRNIITIDMRSKKKDLPKLAIRDISDRNTKDGAVVYIDGEILDGGSHAECINQYLESKFQKNLYDKRCRPLAFDPRMENKDEIEYGKRDQADIDTIMNNVKQMAFAHKSNRDGAIYVEQDSLFNISLQDACYAIKAKYPEYNVLCDETEEKIARMDLRSVKYANKISDLRKCI